jgi:adenylate kinase family enzyme
MKPASKYKKPFNLILLGDPASGKGTQAVRLVKKYHFYNLDMGHEVRTPAALAQYDYAKTTAIGHLTPTAVVRNIFKRVIAATPARQGILFNGTPKMINEAKLVARELARAKRSEPLIIYLNIPQREMFARAENRRRDDDTARALYNRQKYYKEQIARVVAFFAERYTVKKISGMGTEAVVAKRIETAIKKYLKDFEKIHGTTNSPGN